MPGKAHSPEVKAEAIRLYLEGTTGSAIGRKLGLSRFLVYSWIKKLDPAQHVVVPRLVVKPSPEPSPEPSPDPAPEPGAKPKRRTTRRRTGTHRVEQRLRNVEELGYLVYDTVIETLNALRARAIETAKPEWIQAQSADQIALLDTAQWDRVIRVISAFRTAEDGASQAEPADVDQLEQPEVHRNGTVDPAD